MKIRNVAMTCLTIGVGMAALGGLTSCQTEVVSAYDIAVNNGFTGTEEEWLQSLKGSDGADGADGKDASSLSLDEIYSEAVEAGYEKTYLEFIKEYLSINYTEASIKNKALMQTVSINCVFTESVTSNSPFGQQNSTQDVVSMGSGVFYSVDLEEGDAYVITNYHVVYDEYSITENNISDNISVYLYGLEFSDYKIEASYIGGSIANDIAVLKIEDSEVIKSSSASAVTFADSDSIYAGESCFAVGNPEGDGLSVVSGTISVVSEDIDLTIGKTSINVRTIRHDCAINGGNSGGGLFNAAGQLIGIVNAKMESTGIEGMCYALPTNMVKGLAELIIDNNVSNDGSIVPSKCYLGISTYASKMYTEYNDEIGGYVIRSEVSVYEVNSGVCENLLEAQDIINSATLNGVTTVIDTSYGLTELLFTARKNDVLTLNITRDGVTMDVEITLSYTAEL